MTTKKPTPCALCNKPPKDGCSHVDCPSRKPVLWVPQSAGRISPKGHPGKE